ncbi:MAG: AAA family ATPase [Oscillospiraceae bacterium]|nr:AAA family ATPase [Oscillospiraceae bacterium]
MKIKKIHIAAFGKLKDYTLELDNGLNVIYGENEDGKSTVMAFIKMMFYGSGRGSSSVSKNPRIKYTPWSNERPAGRIYFEHKGTNYCLEREFLKSDATDKIRLTNTDTGEVKSVTSSVGNDFFGLTAAGFERTVFIGQIGSASNDDTASDEINSKLSNIVLAGDEDISFKTVLERLNNAKFKLMSKSGRTGIYDKGKAELEAIKLKIRDAELMESRKQAINKRIAEIKEKSEILIKEYREAQKISDSENDIKNQKKLQDFLSLKEELDKINLKIKLKDGSYCDESFIKKVEFCISKVQNAFSKIEERKSEISKLNTAINLAENADSDITIAKKKTIENRVVTSKANLQTLQNKISEREVKLKALLSASVTVKKKAFSPLLLILGALFVVLSTAIFFATSEVYCLLGIALGFVLLTLSFFIKPVDNSFSNKITSDILTLQAEISTLKTEESNINREILSDTEAINELNFALNSDKSMIERNKANLAEENERLIGDEEKYTSATKELFSVFSLYRDTDSVEEIKSLLPSLYETATEQKQIKLRLKYYSDDLGGISYETAREKLEKLSVDNAFADIDFNANKQKLEEINEAISALKSEHSALTTELKTAFRNFETPTELEAKAETLKELLTKQEYFCEISDIAAKTLESSFIEIRRGYGSTLEKRALEIFSKITDEKYSAFNVSKSLDITVEEAKNFGTREIDYLSSGTADQAYLSLRLALSSLMAEGVTLPVFLDDVFAQYDDKRTEMAIKFLKDYSAASQSILFTCHSKLCEIADKSDIPCKKLHNTE